MGYGRLNCETNTETPERVPVPVLNQLGRTKKPSKRKRFLLLCFIASSFLMVVSGVTVSYFVRSRNKGSQSEPLKLSQAITLTCGKTLFPNLCTSSLSNFPGALEAGQRDLIHISVNMTRQRVGKAYSSASLMNNLAMETRVRAAYEDCIELLDDTMDQLYRSMVSVAPPGNQPVNRPRGGSTADIQTWLSASLTNQDTCLEGFSDLSGFVKNQMVNEVKDLSELLSNCLAIFAVSSNNKDFSGVPIQNRRLLGAAESELPESGFPVGKGGFPAWVTGKERRLLQMPAVVIQADIVVSQDGNGTYKTITEAIKAAPESSNRRTIIYVKAGRYEENLKVGRKKTNLMFIGDGKGKTVISAGRSVVGGYTTFRSATFAATGAGFIARDITFENWSGPSMHQAVALRVGADHAVIYRCNVIGYQDTLYVHSQRQFYRECDVYGTVDFVFGNAAVVIQNCSLYARKPLPYQKITITAQNRKDPNQNTGISIHNSRILATSDLENEKWAFPTFLGRPWKLYSRAVYMMCYIGDHVDPAGWLAWNATFALDTLYYGEYMNYGPGGAIGKRVKWPGFRVITSVDEATKFTVGQFIYGSSWLPATGVAFLAGLSV